MKSDDVGKKAVVFESQDRKGITGTITEVFESSFRLVTDRGTVYEFSTKLVNIKFLDGDYK